LNASTEGGKAPSHTAVTSAEGQEKKQRKKEDAVQRRSLKESWLGTARRTRIRRSCFERAASTGNLDK